MLGSARLREPERKHARVIPLKTYFSSKLKIKRSRSTVKRMMQFCSWSFTVNKASWDRSLAGVKFLRNTVVTRLVCNRLMWLNLNLMWLKSESVFFHKQDKQYIRFELYLFSFFTTPRFLRHDSH